MDSQEEEDINEGTSSSSSDNESDEEYPKRISRSEGERKEWKASKRSGCPLNNAFTVSYI